MATDRRLRIALTVMFLLYGGLQLYVVAKADAALALAWPVTAALVAWAALMTVMPLLVWRWDSAAGTPGADRGMAGLHLDGRGVSVLLDRVDPRSVRRAPPGGGTSSGLTARAGFLLAGALTAAVSVYGFVAATRLRIERIVLASPKLPPATGAAHRADLRRPSRRADRCTPVRAIIKKLRELDADVLLSAGDLVDGQADRLNGLAPMLAALQPRLGKFAVTGNHEYFVGLERALAFHERAGFRMLRGPRLILLNTSPSLASMTRPAPVSNYRQHRRTRAVAALRPQRFIILIKHQPRLDIESKHPTTGWCDLHSSGHVHRGQIFPFGLLCV